jgi:hypothetical protein
MNPSMQTTVIENGVSLALRSALLDLADRRRFYERQDDGLGDYFFDSLFSEIDAPALYGGIHRSWKPFIARSRRGFPPQSIIKCRRRSGGFSRSGLSAGFPTHSRGA